MEENIAISTLNDFIFCPYSIYLHHVYMETDEELIHATPQVQGKAAHKTVDEKTLSSKTNEILSLPIYSEMLGIYGRIDIFRRIQKTLIERKYQMKRIYQGQKYQLWAQYFCMIEMGFLVKHIAFYEMVSNKIIPIEIPQQNEYQELQAFIQKYRQYNPTEKLIINPNKCIHCIYCNLCDKTDTENVYS